MPVTRRALSLIVTYSGECGSRFNKFVQPVPPVWRSVRVGDRLRRRQDGQKVTVVALWVEHAEPALSKAVQVGSVVEWERTGRTLA